MTQEEIKPHDHPDFVGGWVWRDLEMRWIEQRIAEAVAAEREACAKVADDHERQRCEAWAKVLTTGGEVPSASLSAVADAIRARGEIK